MEFAASIMEMLEVCSQFEEMREVEATDFQIHLINLNCSLGRRVRIGDEFLELVNRDLAPITETRYACKRENYTPNVIVLPSALGNGATFTCNVFATGSLTISGRVPQDVVEGFRYVVTILEEHADHLLADLTDKNRKEEATKRMRSWTELLKVPQGLCHSHLPVSRLVPECSYCQRYGNVFASTH
ncbi:hypothetical protein EBT31_23115 [bacterium]|nr:hypothetical protein [bacterium]